MIIFKRTILSFMAFMVFLLSASTFTGCGETKVHLNKYMTIKIDGVDGYAKAYASFDYDSFEKDYGSKVKVTSDKKYQALNDAATDMLISFCVDWKLDKAVNLKNGDTVTLTWDCDDQKAKSNFKANLKYSDITVKVEDLKEAADFDPFDYVTVTFDGYDGMGKAKVELNDSRAEMNSLTVDYSAAKLQDLSNGDVIEIRLTLALTPAEWTSRYGNVIVNNVKTYEVCGLQELAEIDPFDNVKITYTGIAPFAQANIEYSGEPYLLFSGNQLYDLKNGDVFTLEVSSYDKETLASQGYKLSETKKTYTVENVPEYVSSADQITEDALSSMQEQAESVILSYTAGWVEADSLKSYDYLGSYLLFRKVPGTFSVNNCIYLVYVLHAENSKDGAIDDYYYVRYENAIYCPEDHTCQVNVNEYKKAVETFYGDSKKYYYNGYKDLHSMESALITKNLADYTTEATGELAKK